MTIKKIIGWSLFLSIVVGGEYWIWAMAGWVGIVGILVTVIISIGVSVLIDWLIK